MPKHYVKKTVRRKHTRRSKRKSPYSSYTSHIPANLHMPLPERYTGSFETVFSGTTSVAAGLATNYFGCVAGSLYAPFSSGGGKLFTGMAGTVLIPATTALATLSPAGLSKLATLYENCVVHHISYSVTMSPIAGADISQLIIYPIMQEDVGSEALDAETASRQPYSKAIVVTGNNNIAKNRVSMKLSLAKFCGMNKTFYDSQFFQAPTSTLNEGVILMCVYQTFSNATPSSPLNWQVKLVQTATLYETTAGGSL